MIFRFHCPTILGLQDASRNNALFKEMVHVLELADSWFHCDIISSDLPNTVQ